MFALPGVTILPLLTIGGLLLWSRKWFRKPLLTGYRALRNVILFPIKCTLIVPTKWAWRLLSCKSRCFGDWEWRFQKPPRRSESANTGNVNDDDHSAAFHYAIYISFLCLPAVSSELARAYRCIPFDDGTRCGVT